MSARPSLAFSPGAAGPVLRLADWRDEAACGSQPHLFFGPDGETPTERERRERKAKAVCKACPVIAQCRLWFQRSSAEYGVWAGMGEADRGRSYARPHTSRADRQRLAAILEAGERSCSGKCGLTKSVAEFPSRGGTCRACLGDRLREINRQRRERGRAA